MVSNARLDLPEPDSPVITMRASRGRLRWRSLRLCSRAPETTIWSWRLTEPSLRAVTDRQMRTSVCVRNLRESESPVLFGYTILYVRDVAASVKFYERAFRQPARLLHESGQYAELETGPTTLAFAAHELASANLPDQPAPGDGAAAGDGFEVCFVTEDVEAAFSRAVE